MLSIGKTKCEKEKVGNQSRKMGVCWSREEQWDVGGDDSKWDECACMDTEYMYVGNV
jgi:hypothetical protein